MTTVRTLLAAAAFALATGAASAAPMFWTGSLTGSQEVPPNATTGTGAGSIWFDPATNVLTVQMDWLGLTGDGMQAHIHCCATPTSNAGIALDLWLTNAPRPASGGFFATWDLDLVNPFRAAFVAANGGSALSAMARLVTAFDLGGSAYFNIHTMQFPGGEIRGNIFIPEPEGLALIALAACAAGFARRRAARRLLE